MGVHPLNFDSSDLTPDERLDALAEVLAEGLLYLAENGMLPLISVGKEGKGSLQDNRADNENYGK